MRGVIGTLGANCPARADAGGDIAARCPYLARARVGIARRRRVMASVVELRLQPHARRAAGTEEVLQLFQGGRVMVLSAEWGERSQTMAGCSLAGRNRAEQILRAQRQDLCCRPCKVAGLCEFFSQRSR